MGVETRLSQWARLSDILICEHFQLEDELLNLWDAAIHIRWDFFCEKPVLIFVCLHIYRFSNNLVHLNILKIIINNYL
jgi:hypothetical protein